MTSIIIEQKDRKRLIKFLEEMSEADEIKITQTFSIPDSTSKIMLSATFNEDLSKVNNVHLLNEGK